MEDLYTSTANRAQQIRDAGYVLREKWECEARREMKASREMRDFFDSTLIRDPMTPRDVSFELVFGFYLFVVF